jgi:hypothetical protein
MYRREAQYVIGILPGDMAAGALNGDWVSLKNFNHVEVVFFKAAGAAGEIPTFTFEQATNVAGAGAKALNFTRAVVKDGADQTVIGAPTEVTQASGNTYAPAAGNTQTIGVVEFDAQHLDVQNGFDCLRVRVNDVGVTAQLVGVLYRLSESRFDPMTQNAIID